MNWIKIDYGNLNAEKLTPGKSYLIYENDQYYLASYIINGEFLWNGEKHHPDFYCELTKPIK